MGMFTLESVLNADGIPKLVLKPATITAQWVDTQARCGDAVNLTATIAPAPPNGTMVQVDVFVDGGSPPTSGNGFSFKATINSGAINVMWPAKTATASWRTDKMRFRVTLKGASGSQTGDSTNTLGFIDRPTVVWQTLHNHNNSPAATENHDASLDADRVHYRLLIALTGATLSAAAQSSLVSNIQSVWNGGFSNKFFHRTGCGRGDACDCTHDCCKVSWKLDVAIVSTGQHLLVTIVDNPDGGPPFRSGTSDTTARWSSSPASSTEYAHEVGHILGQYDEYTGTGAVNDPTGAQPAPPPSGEENLMSIVNNSRLFVRHYRWALRFLNANDGGDAYKTIQK